MIGSLSMGVPRLRQAVRALLLDEDDNVLLVHFDWPGLHIAGGFWACPGGGVEVGESPETALRRELAEEVGLDDPGIVGPVWRLTRIFPMADWDGQTDVTYLVRNRHFAPAPRLDLRAEHVQGVRWFAPSEMGAGTHTFSPRDLSEQLARVLAEGVPTLPYEIPALD